MKSTSSFFPIIDIREGIIILKNSFYARLVEVFPTDVSFLEDSLKENFIKKYEAFLLGLNLQIKLSVCNFIISKVNALQYIGNIESKKFKLLYENEIKTTLLFSEIYEQRYFVSYIFESKRKSLIFSHEFSGIKKLVTSYDTQLEYLLIHFGFDHKFLYNSSEIEVIFSSIYLNV
jgi:hypothetical protein